MYKHILFVLFMSAFTLSAQTYFSLTDEFGNDTDTVEASGDVYANTDLKFKLNNLLNEQLDSVMIKHISTVKNPSWYGQLCEGAGAAGQCYDIDIQISMNGQNFELLTSNVDSGAYNELKVSYMCGGVVGTGVTRLYVYHMSDSLNGDTITYIFNGLDMSSVEDLNKEDIKVFPSLADYEVNVQINKPITNGEARILNLIGQEVSKTNIVQEQTRIDVRLLPKGCYFMEIREAGKTIKSERFYISR